MMSHTQVAMGGWYVLLCMPEDAIMKLSEPCWQQKAHMVYQ